MTLRVARGATRRGARRAETILTGCLEHLPHTRRHGARRPSFSLLFVRRRHRRRARKSPSCRASASRSRRRSSSTTSSAPRCGARASWWASGIAPRSMSPPRPGHRRQVLRSRLLVGERASAEIYVTAASMSPPTGAALAPLVGERARTAALARRGVRRAARGRRRRRRAWERGRRDRRVGRDVRLFLARGPARAARALARPPAAAARLHRRNARGEPSAPKAEGEESRQLGVEEEVEAQEEEGARELFDEFRRRGAFLPFVCSRRTARVCVCVRVRVCSRARRVSRTRDAHKRGCRGTSLHGDTVAGRCVANVD